MFCMCLPAEKGNTMKRMERIAFPAGPGAVCFTPILREMPLPVVLRSDAGQREREGGLLAPDAWSEAVAQIARCGVGACAARRCRRLATAAPLPI